MAFVQFHSFHFVMFDRKICRKFSITVFFRQFCFIIYWSIWNYAILNMLKKGRKTNSKPIPITSTGILLQVTLILMTISLNKLMLYFYRRSLSQGCFVFAWGLNYWKLHKFILYAPVSNISILNFYIKINKSLWSRKKAITARTSDLQNQDF